MKINLLNDGGYGTQTNLEFPIALDDEEITLLIGGGAVYDGIVVPVELLTSVGFEIDLKGLEGRKLTFFKGTEAEEINSQLEEK